jgi:hypothetical protein
VDQVLCRGIALANVTETGPIRVVSITYLSLTNLCSRGKLEPESCMKINENF